MKPTKVKKMNVTRFSPDFKKGGFLQDPLGEYVTYEDYMWMSDYADRLVEHGNLPCLPKDLENLREANLQLAMENQQLQDKLTGLYEDMAGGDV